MSSEAARPFADLSATGLLWLFNRTVLHPRGFALALAHDDAGEVCGWTLVGGGSTPMTFDSATDDRAFAAVEALLGSKRQPQDRMAALEAAVAQLTLSGAVHTSGFMMVMPEAATRTAAVADAVSVTVAAPVVQAAPRAAFVHPRFRASYANEGSANDVNPGGL